MPSPSRADLENAARTFFEEMAAEVDQPRSFHPDHYDDDLAFNIEASRDRTRSLDDQLRENTFDGSVKHRAEELASRCGATFEQLSERERLFALQLAARAEREQMEVLIHGLTRPASRRVPADDLFAAAPAAKAEPSAPTPEATGLVLHKAVEIYLTRKQAKGLSLSQVDEVGRALGWLKERLGDQRPLNSVTKTEMRTFRNDVARLDVTLRGRGAPFEARLTSVAADQIKSVTALRYWKSVQAFFAWCSAEEYSKDDPTAGLVMDTKKDEEKQSPDPFTPSELQHLFQTPLYAGYKSHKRLGEPGDINVREGHWWAGILLMHTGLRAGELSQFLPTDFDFAADIPHLKVQRVNEAGKSVKSTKNLSSVRDVPLSPVLLELGLQQFVSRRAKAHPKERVFREFRLGARGRTSDGMTKFWGDYLKKCGLWKEGRATHVWRHTLIARLRAGEVPEEDIAAFVGHARRTVTAGYGGAYPLSRKAKTLQRLNWGFDVVKAAGGPYNPALHG